MREIKFKAWDDKNKIMLNTDTPNLLIHFNGEINSFGKNGVINGVYFTNQVKLLQYTGLKDKNGKEIYEGDIIKRESMAPGGLDRIGKITIEDGVIWIESNVDSVCLFDEIDELEIIGNIYENPELLEGEEC